MCVSGCQAKAAQQGAGWWFDCSFLMEAGLWVLILMGSTHRALQLAHLATPPLQLHGSCITPCHHHYYHHVSLLF